MKNLEIKYYTHSGFSCAIDSNLIIFDYWLGENGQLEKQYQIESQDLNQYQNVYVFVSHSHPDHFDPVIYNWSKDKTIQYFVSEDVPSQYMGRRLHPYEDIQINSHFQVKVYDSTDLGVSYLIIYDDIRIFHAGDLNYWHWREESTIQEIEEAESNFKKAIKPISQEPIDIAFFPVDPRQGSMFDAGANYFIMEVKPTLFIPMHFWNRSEIAIEFARRCKTRDTEIIAMTHPGNKLNIEIDDQHNMNVRYIKEQTMNQKQLKNIVVEIDKYKDDPFSESDLPIHFEE